MIAEGRVAKDGVVLDTPATLLPSLHGVTVDGEEVAAPSPARLFLFHKPAGVLTAERDFSGRPTIYDRLPKDLPRLVPVGRLDLNTEGLLLMTTDGGLKRQLELPATGIERSYRARAYGPVTQAQLEELIEGVEIEGVRYGSINANLERRTGANVWIEMILTEGKNREVRRVLEHLGLRVGRLIRTRYGPFVLGDLPPGEVGEVRAADLAGFRQTLAKQGAQAASRAEPVGVSGSARAAPRARPAPTAPAVEPERPSARPARPVRPSGNARRPAAPEAADRATPQRPGRADPVRAGRSDRGAPARQDRAGPGAADRPARAFAPRTGASDSGRSGRPDRGAPSGDRPMRAFAPRPGDADTGRGGRADRAAPQRFGRGDAGATDRPARAFSPRAATSGGDRPDRASPHRPGRGDGGPAERPSRQFAARSGGGDPDRRVPPRGAKPEPVAEQPAKRPARAKRQAGWAVAKPKSGPTRKGRK